MSNDDEHHAFHVPLPAELVQAMVAQHDRHHMSRESEDQRLDRFLDGLDVDSCLALRYLLRCPSEHAFANVMHYDGVLHTLLRVKHGVDPHTGKSLSEQLQADEPPTPPTPS